jgi:guanylate kinase
MSDPTSYPRGILLVLSAPSGAGKTTLAQRLIQELPRAHFSVSVTTRPARGQEREGVDYRFVDTLTFKQQIERNEFVEWAEVHGHFYGSPQVMVDQAREDNGVAVFDIDVQGGHSIRKKHPDTVLVFVLPPSMEELERRLRDRRTDSDEEINRRMLAARSEIERGYASYDYLIVNDDIDRAYAQLRSIVVAEKCRRGRVEVPALKLHP